MSTKVDYEHALVEIRRRLHDGKAAVMVGAGFSLNAVNRSDVDKKFPLWAQLAAKLAERLYPDEKDRREVLRKSGATSSALRLAEEFEVAFRRVGLIEFIRDVIRDDEFEPGPLHRELLELPWADVFTTNYDRLLEAARSSIAKHYDVVYTVNDLPLARKARIVKLHGTLPGLDQLVLTEEDYRTYPKRFAPLVTAVQAALTENVLCLIGFSGDDPNFLAWTGWLRDEMRSAVPNTFFFTDSKLKPFQRKLLEDRHIVPIPLKDIADSKDWGESYGWLFDQLGKPPGPPQAPWNVGLRYAHSWMDDSIADEPSFPEKQDWIDSAIRWHNHRRQYRGWYVLHRNGVDILDSHTENWITRIDQKTADAWSEPVALFVLHELVWRWSTALQPLNDNFVFQVLEPEMERFAVWRSRSHSRRLR